MVEWKKILQQKSKSRRQPESAPISSLDVCDSLHTNSLLPQSPSVAGSGLSDAVTAKPDLASGTSPAEDPLPAASGNVPKGPDDLLPDEIHDYYYPDLDMDSAKRLLQSKPIGTFLLRHSQCPDAKYTLSVRSEKHVFNVRIFKRLSGDGDYHLDAPRYLRRYFPTISDLLRHYSSSPKELIALCSGDEGVDERTTFRLMYPLSKSESTLNLPGTAAAGGGEAGEEPNAARSRPVTRQTGGSLKAMIKWL